LPHTEPPRRTVRDRHRSRRRPSCGRWRPARRDLQPRRSGIGLWHQDRRRDQRGPHWRPQRHLLDRRWVFGRLCAPVNGPALRGAAGGWRAMCHHHQGFSIRDPAHGERRRHCGLPGWIAGDSRLHARKLRSREAGQDSREHQRLLPVRRELSDERSCG
jgi:hypothetical protein